MQGRERDLPFAVALDSICQCLRYENALSMGKWWATRLMITNVISQN